MTELETTTSSLKAPGSEPGDGHPLVLEVNNVSKRFCRDLKRSLLYGVLDIQREILGQRQDFTQLRPKEFMALQDVSFTLKAGSALGLVGLNGCGKTTLMRVLSGLIKPSAGSVTVRGRMAPLLALGAGFIPVLTGRENIYTNMSVLGLTQEEIDARFEQVVDFAEIGFALDAPVQSYSSGMVARLGFACAICTQPDVMLIDEVLAVGDLKFREKCIGAIEALRAQGTSMIMVHHSPDLLLTVCDQAIYMVKGRIECQGEAPMVIEQYERNLYLTRRAPRSRTAVAESSDEDASSREGLLEIDDVKLLDEKGREVTNVECGHSCAIALSCNVLQDGQPVFVRISIYRLPHVANLAATQQEVLVLSLNSAKDRAAVGPLSAGRHHLRLDFPVVALPPARYKITAHIHSRQEVLASFQGLKFEVTYAGEGVGGPFFQKRQWFIDGAQAPLREAADRGANS